MDNYENGGSEILDLLLGRVYIRGVPLVDNLSLVNHQKALTAGCLESISQDYVMSLGPWKQQPVKV